MQLWPQTDFWGLFDFEGWVCNVRSGAKCNWNPIKLTGQQGCAGRGKIIHRLTLKTLNIKMYHTYFSKRAFQIILKVRILHHLPI